MKKIFLMIGICFLNVVVLAQSVSCANGDGIELKGINGTVYCRSKVPMNWWSVFAWCDTIGKKIITPDEDCKCNGFEGCDTSLQCPNLVKIAPSGVIAPTDKIHSAYGSAWVYVTQEGSLFARDKKYGDYSAVCK